MSWLEFRELRDGLQSAEFESLDKVRRLKRTVKRLEKRLDRLQKTAARIPKGCRGDETEQLWSPESADFR